MCPSDNLLGALQRYWGYSSFRPLQERIVRSLIAGRDTCVVMPTGGGKSLCYQLPAVLSGKTAIVISPLIALMQDQAAQLSQMGIPSAVLNSTLKNEEQRRIVQEARSGAFRLLYLSPERLARADTVAWLKKVPIVFFTIDEAHCISEWGHEFRPEYRQLNRLRQVFPDIPIAAFTASATRHVRHDILAQLALRDPDKYIASFHRPNLRYLVRECESWDQADVLIEALGHYGEGNVIVYAPTINNVEETVDLLGDRGITAVPYHARMPAADRARNQERWMSDEVRVLVGTIAFGLGINKAAVRAVIHLALPKSIEQYYQEAGRAGRDGLPADCLLLWRKKDAGLLGFFANQITEAAERDRAWQRYRIIREFVDSQRCRHLQICEHFGEKPKWTSCSACDVCSAVPGWLTATPAVSKRRAGERKAAAASAQGYLVPSTGGLGDVDEHLRSLVDYLKEWRRTLARERGVPAFQILHDTTLEEVCRKRPEFFAELRGITGIGDRKMEQIGQPLLDALARFDAGARSEPTAAPKTTPAIETLHLLEQGKTFAEIAELRGRQVATVVNAVAGLVETGQLEFRAGWMDANRISVIEAACTKLGLDRLKPLKEAVPPEITYDEIRLIVAKLRRSQQQNGAA